MAHRRLQRNLRSSPLAASPPSGEAPRTAPGRLKIGDLCSGKEKPHTWTSSKMFSRYAPAKLNEKTSQLP